MKYFDDQASPLAPFSGDQSGDIFTDSDVLTQSPLASARFVETQSGYLVVLKEIGERLALSVKRQIGTLPSSQIMLTSDESRKLSKVLDESAVAIAANSQAKRRELNRLFGSRSEIDGTASSITGSSVDSYRDDVTARRERTSGEESEDIEDALLSRKRRLGRQISTILFSVAGVFVFIALSAAFITQKTESAPSAAPAPVVKVEVPKPMSTENVDKFARAFVSNLLDFNPATYRVSQVQAMADMAPSLMETYWNETSFPLSKKQLTATGEKTLVIDRIEQERSGTESKDVNVYASLTTDGQEQGSPVHLLLTIGVKNDGTLTVLEQKDVSTEDENSYAEDVTFDNGSENSKPTDADAKSEKRQGKRESSDERSDSANPETTRSGTVPDKGSKNSPKADSDSATPVKKAESRVAPVATSTARKDWSEDKRLLAGKQENAAKKAAEPVKSAPEVPATEKAPAENAPTEEFGYSDLN